MVCVPRRDFIITDKIHSDLPLNVFIQNERGSGEMKNICIFAGSKN